MFESPHQLQAPHSIRVWCFLYSNRITLKGRSVTGRSGFSHCCGRNYKMKYGPDRRRSPLLAKWAWGLHGAVPKSSIVKPKVLAVEKYCGQTVLWVLSQRTKIHRCALRVAPPPFIDILSRAYCLSILSRGKSEKPLTMQRRQDIL